ncbi:C-type mannose receptor 2-like, partial [Silurus meridionalis]
KYYLIQEGRNWIDAQAYCKATHTDLAIFKSNDNMNKLLWDSQKDHLTFSAWIGLYVNTSSWRWSFRNKSLGSLTMWLSGEPNNSGGQQECGGIYPAGWTDKDCSSKYSFVCFDDTKSGPERYINIADGMSWHEAQSYCRQYYTDLTNTLDQTEYSIVKGFYPLAWIGLFRDSWKWVDNTTFSTLSWIDKQPDNRLNNENCGFLNNSQVGDALCSDVMPFFCYSGSVLIVLPIRLKYYLIPEGRNWVDAQAYCKATNTDLAIIKSNDNMNKLLWDSQKDHLTFSAWIGLYINTSSWRWSFRNKSLGSPRMWSSGEPNNVGGRQECGAIYSGGWTDKDCSSKNSFVCFDDTKSGPERYINISDGMSWHEAQSYCRQYYTDLTNTLDQTEYSTVKRFYNLAWIGLFRDSWMWVDKTTFSTLSWIDKQPDNLLKNENCGFLNNSQVGDALCSDVMPFFCYRGSVPFALLVRLKYYLIQQGRNWSYAQAYCKAKHIDLAIVANNDHMVRLLSEAQKNQLASSAWLGLFNDIHSWRWSFRNKPLVSTNMWLNGEPNNAGGHQECIVISPYGWIDRDCSTKYSFICFDDTKSGPERYINISDGMSWREAQSYCRQYYTDLTNTLDQTEYSIVKEFFPLAWIGLFRDAWKWVDNTTFSTLSWL